MGDWMVKAQAESMQAKTSGRIIPIAILHVSTNRMPQIGGMDADLVLATSLQLELNERVVFTAIQDMVVRNGKLASVVVWRTVSEICPVVFKPALDSAFILLHNS